MVAGDAKQAPAMLRKARGDISKGAVVQCGFAATAVVVVAWAVLLRRPMAAPAEDEEAAQELFGGGRGSGRYGSPRYQRQRETGVIEVGHLLA